MTLLFNFLSLPDHVVSQIKALAKIIYRQQMINWMKFLKVTILFFCYQQVEAQVSKDALDGMTSYMLEYSAPYYTTVPLQSAPVIPLQSTPLLMVI